MRSVLGATVRRVHPAWPTTLAIVLYVALTTLADRPELGSLRGETGHRLALATAAVALAVLAPRGWRPPARPRPGPLGRHLVVGGLALFGIGGLVTVALSRSTFGVDPAVLDPLGLLALAVVGVGALCSGVARSRERGLALGASVRCTTLSVLGVVLTAFGVQAGLTADPATVRDLPWSLLFVVLLAVPAAAQARRPETSLAATLQVAAVLVAHAAGPLAAGYLGEDRLAQFLVVVAVVLVAVHPARRPSRPAAPHRWVAATTAVAAVPVACLAVTRAIATIEGGPGADEVGTMYALAVLAGLGITALRFPGWRTTAATTAAAVGLLGAASALAPLADGSWGRGWGLAAVCWATTLGILVVRTEVRSDGPATRRDGGGGRGPAPTTAGAGG